MFLVEAYGEEHFSEDTQKSLLEKDVTVGLYHNNSLSQ